MHLRRQGPLLAFAAGLLTFAARGAGETSMPLHGCTFYGPRLSKHFESCADFSVVRGRHGCQKLKGPCPACIRYPGDDLQMWLPDYFVEVTRHFGKSMFAESLDGIALGAQLDTAKAFWRAYLADPGALPDAASSGTSMTQSAASAWHARVLTVPYGNLATNYPPLPPSIGTGLPVCYAALSEFLPAQWAYNAADAPYALALAPLGIPACLTILGGGATYGIGEAKKRIDALKGAAPRLPSLPASGCATPVFLAEAMAKNALPTSDTLAPLSDIRKLCVGTWGNLVPRTGWIMSDDPMMSAMLAAAKFISLAGDMHLSAGIKARFDDKWQIVYPPRLGAGCFEPGSPMSSLMLGGDDPLSRQRDELRPDDPRKDHTYVIAVWRRRGSCQEPLETVGGWTAAYRGNHAKNVALCQAVGGA